MSGTQTMRTQQLHTYANEIGGLAPQYKTMNDVGNILNENASFKTYCEATVENAVMMMSNVLIDTSTGKISSGYESITLLN